MITDHSTGVSGVGALINPDLFVYIFTHLPDDTLLNLFAELVHLICEFPNALFCPAKLRIDSNKIHFAHAARTFPDTSFGNSASLCAASARDSCLADSILSRMGPTVVENQSSTPVSAVGFTISVSAIMSGRTAGYAAPSALCANRSMLSGAVAERYVNSRKAWV